MDLKRYFAMGRREELSYLLNYRWDESKLTKLKKRGVEIEVFIGKKDKDSRQQSRFGLFWRVCDDISVQKRWTHLEIEKRGNVLRGFIEESFEAPTPKEAFELAKRIYKDRDFSLVRAKIK